jgi:hypothetical protein
VIEWGRVGYTFFMLLATGVAGWLYRRNQASSELRSGQKLGIAIGGIIGATFAAKVPFILTSDPSAGVLAAWFGDGKTVLWGLAGGYVGVEVAKWSLYVRGRTGNRFVVPVAAAIAIGRLGCLFNGCCYGIPTDQSWGVRSIAADGGVLLRHPAPLYESFFHAAFAVVAARCGAAVSADVGVKQYGGQVDALRTLGVAPRAYLLLPITVAFLVGTPLLEWLSFSAARWISMVTFSWSYPEIGPYFWQQHFERRLVDPSSWLNRGWDWVLLKNLICGLGTAAISYHQGLAPKRSASDVSRSITSTVLWTTLFVLVVHFIVALFEF